MARFLRRLMAKPVPQLLVRTLQPLVRGLRNRRHPNVPQGHEIKTVDFQGQKIHMERRRWNDDDRIAIEQCFQKNQYAFPVGAHGILTQRLYDDIVGSGRKPLIVDCGANIGASVRWFHARYPEACIVAVEPDASNFGLLQVNCAGLDVRLHQAGIGPADGSAFLAVGYGDMSHTTNAMGEGSPVDIVSLPTLLQQLPEGEYAPFLLKIDVEGAESSLFEGDCSAFDRFPLILLEPHDWLFPGELSSRSFFRFHAAAGREFCMNNENVASIVNDSRLPAMMAEYRRRLS